MRVVCISFSPPLNMDTATEAIARIVILEIGETLAVAELASSAIAAAGAAAAETILGGLYAGSVNHSVNKAEVTRQSLIVDLVDNGDGDRLMSRE